MERPRFDIDQRVMAVKTIRNDGTFPDANMAKGDVLVEKGVKGYVVHIGTFLQDITVYAVQFENGRLVGCLERELAPLEERPAEP